MDESHDLSHWLKLARVPGLAADALAELIERFGSIADVADAKSSDLVAAGLSEKSAAALGTIDRSQLDFDLRWTELPGQRFIPFNSPLFPTPLTQLTGVPVGIFVRGDASVLSQPQLAIVGARNPTRGGRETAEAFAQHLAACGLHITSGLAAGIDAAAHRGALRAGGTTIAVCATGLDIVYPSDHRELAERICERGALVSEFPPGTGPLKFHFPRRNRLISGLSLGVLVVEAAIHSGSLITARFAADQGREVFAIPGSIHNPLARGCHQLLKQGAKLVESADDVLTELGPLAASLCDESTFGRPASGPEKHPDDPASSGPTLDKEYKMLLDALGFEPTSVDQLVARTGLKAEEVASMLLILELDGRVASSPGALYSLVPEGVP
jgi:DNA processing protein